MSCIFSPSNPVLLWKRGRGERGRKAFSLSLWGASRVFSTKKVFLIAPEKKREKVGLRRARACVRNWECIFFPQIFGKKGILSPFTFFSLFPSSPFFFQSGFSGPLTWLRSRKKKEKEGKCEVVRGKLGLPKCISFLEVVHHPPSPKSKAHTRLCPFLSPKKKSKIGGGKANDLVRFHRRQKNGKCGGLDYVIKVFSPSRNFMLDLFLHSLLKIPLFPAQNLLWFRLTCSRSCYRAPVNPIGTKNFLVLNF